MKILKLLISPMRDKFKLQRKVNTLELQNKELEMILSSRVSETLMNTLSNKEEVDRLLKENQRLRAKVKEFKKANEK